jgi:hypothetical protein
MHVIYQRILMYRIKLLLNTHWQAVVQYVTFLKYLHDSLL